jgi:hypothetical protein
MNTTQLTTEHYLGQKRVAIKPISRAVFEVSL